MWTNEFNYANVTITVMDDGGEHEDVKVIFEEDCVVIKQESDDEILPLDMVIMSHKMFNEILAAYQMPEGMYTSE